TSSDERPGTERIISSPPPKKSMSPLPDSNQGPAGHRCERTAMLLKLLQPVALPTAPRRELILECEACTLSCCTEGFRFSLERRMYLFIESEEGGAGVGGHFTQLRPTDTEFSLH